MVHSKTVNNAFPLSSKAFPGHGVIIYRPYTVNTNHTFEAECGWPMPSKKITQLCTHGTIGNVVGCKDMDRLFACLLLLFFSVLLCLSVSVSMSPCLSVSLSVCLSLSVCHYPPPPSPHPHPPPPPLSLSFSPFDKTGPFTPYLLECIFNVTYKLTQYRILFI